MEGAGHDLVFNFEDGPFESQAIHLVFTSTTAGSGTGENEDGQFNFDWRLSPIPKSGPPGPVKISR